MLLQIRDYIQHQGVVSQQQLSREFNLDNEALEPMLAVWIKRNIINIYQVESCKSSCFRCKNVFYQYCVDA